MYECAGQGVAFLTGRAIDLAVLAYLLQHGTPIDVIETVVTKPSKGTINRIIKHVVKRGSTPKLVVPPAQIHAMVSRLEGGFQYKVESMCFDTGAQALLVYADTHNQFMIGGGNKADVQVLGAAKESGFECDRRGTIVFAAVDTDDQTPGFNLTPVQAEFITCARDQLTKQLGGYGQLYALKWNANLRAPGEGQSKLWRKIKHAVPGILRLGGRDQEIIPLRRDDVQGCFAIDTSLWSAPLKTTSYS
jgi:hypothetical protein